MANNDRGQSLISKYVWVIETIYRAKKISFKDLNEKWLRDIDISRGGYSKTHLRQLAICHLGYVQYKHRQ